MTLDLTGQTVVSVRLDGSILYVDLDDDWSRAIENDDEFTAPDGAELRTVDGDEPLILTALTAAVGTPHTSFSYTDTGDLTIGIGGGELRVGPSPSWESWNFVGPNKERVVALAGGELAIWS